METTRRQFIKNALIAGAVIALPVTVAPNIQQATTLGAALPSEINLDAWCKILGLSRKPASFPTYKVESDKELRCRLLNAIRGVRL